MANVNRTFELIGNDCIAEHDGLSNEFEKTQNEIGKVEVKISICNA